MTLNVPGLGEVSREARFGWYVGPAVALPVLDGHACQIVLDGYEAEFEGAKGRDEFHAAIASFLSCPRAVLEAAEGDIYAYYRDTVDLDTGGAEDSAPCIAAPGDVWPHIQFGRQAMVSRRIYGDQGVYVSLSCGCDWEPEHGLQIVFRGGAVVCKVGPYDGHLTQSDAYDDDDQEQVIYR